MKVVILAAGKGSRFGAAGEKTPKCLFQVNGKPILYHVFDSLPETISEIIVVIAHLGSEIQKAVGTEYKGRPITFCWMRPLTGTAGALWSARPLLSDRFLVVNGDDILDADDVQTLVSQNCAWGLSKQPAARNGYWQMQLDDDGYVSGYTLGRGSEESKQPCYLSTGAFVLPEDIFEGTPVQMKNGEYGLPQTLIRMTNKLQFKGVLMRQWLSINNPTELGTANLLLPRIRQVGPG